MAKKQAAPPKKMSLNGSNLTFRPMDASDRNTILSMAQHMTETDLAFMRRDITQPDVIDAWVQEIQNHRAYTLLVEDDDQVVAYGTLYFSQFYWNRHIAEVRVLVTSPYRNRGIGAKLVRELMQKAHDFKLDKLICYLSADDKSARKMVESLGFRPEAVLADWVKMRDERTKDLLIMATALGELH
ncbi:MAG: GNAT family N-acetyltransferase [Chloroflexi bacterium]|nr:GNAT family N-acetyltransferase [Chloroflexota bacterium]